MKFQFGWTVKEVLSGFEGTVVGYAVYAYNVDRVCVRPLGLKEDGTPKEYDWFDVSMCQTISETFLEGLEKIPMETPKFKLLDEVKDSMSPFKGKVVVLAKYITGCNRIGVQSAGMHESLPVEEQWFSDQRFDLVAPAETVLPEKRPGGPMKAPGMVRNPRQN